MNLDTLTPERKDLVIDAVRRSGISVRSWSNYGNGRQPAAANPKYCYEWSFVGSGKVALTIWRVLVEKRRGKWVLEHNARRAAEGPDSRRRKPAWRRRSAKLDEAIQIAARDAIPIRAIICTGKRRRAKFSGKASEVHKRELDPEPWAVTAYDMDTGEYLLTRGARPRRLVREVRPAGHLAAEALADKVAGEAAILRAFARAVRSSLGTDTDIRRDRIEVLDTYSGGSRAVVGKLRGRGGSIEVWLDRFADGITPRFQYCIACSNERRLREIEDAAAPLIGYPRIRRTATEDTGVLTRMIPTMDSGDYGQVVAESYKDADEMFFGVYADSPRGRLPAVDRLAKKAAAFLKPLVAAIREYDQSLGSSRKHGAPVAPAKDEEESALLAAEARRERGQGFQFSAADRMALEEYGMQRAEKWLRKHRSRFQVTRVHKRRPYDLHCTCGKDELCVEVKCTQTAGHSIFLTKNEVDLVKNGRRVPMLLYVLSRVALKRRKGKPHPTGGTERVITDWRIGAKEAVPVTYSYRLPSRKPGTR